MMQTAMRTMGLDQARSERCWGMPRIPNGRWEKHGRLYGVESWLVAAELLG